MNFKYSLERNDYNLLQYSQYKLFFLTRILEKGGRDRERGERERREREGGERDRRKRER